MRLPASRGRLTRATSKVQRSTCGATCNVRCDVRRAVRRATCGAHVRRAVRCATCDVND